MLTGLSIIIPTKDRGTVFNKTLDAVYVATKSIVSEIIIINDSKTNQLTIKSDYADRVKVIDNPKSGVASARNLGAKQSNYSNLLFLDDDIIVSEDNIKALNSLVEKHPNCAINFNWEYPSDLIKQINTTQFGRYLISNGFTSLKGWSQELKWNNHQIFEVDYIASYFLFLSKNTFDLIGGYNESFPHAGAEDFEFAKRLKLKGIVGLCNPLSIVLHNEEDRIELTPWIQRKERAAETRKIAVDLGNNEVAIYASVLKIKVLSGIYYFRSVFFMILKLIPNLKLFDKLFFKIVNVLLAVYLHKGYFKAPKS